MTFVAIFQLRVRKERQARRARFATMIAANRRRWAASVDDAELLVAELFTGASGVYVLGEDLRASTQRPFLGPSAPF